MSDLCPVSVSQDSTEDQYQPETVGESNLLLLHQKKYCNVTFTFPDLPERVEAHKFCLMASSPVFAKIFRMRKSGNVKGKEIEITDSTPETFQRFLEFIYAYKFNVDIAGALDLLQLSQKYKVHPLAKKCEELLQTKIQVEDSVKVFEAARRYGREDLMDQASQIMVKSILNLIETDALANAEEETLVYLLERDDLIIEEVKLFQLILKWGKIQVEETGHEQSLTDKLKNVVSKIRFTNMAPIEFTKLVIPTGLLSPEESLSVYSYLSGDEATRAALKINFNTTGRIVGKVEKFVDFFTEKQFRSYWAPAFSHQGFHFKVERQPQAQAVTKGWSGCLQKTAVISSIKFQWPVATGRYGRAAYQNMDILIVEWSDSNDPDCIGIRKFERRLNGSISNEIDVKPPVELITGRLYAVIVENKSPALDDEKLHNDPQFYYGHVLPTSDCTARLDLTLENCCLDLKETQLVTSYFALATKFDDLPFTLAVIKGITIEMV